jgi:hypothetical protein
MGYVTLCISFIWNIGFQLTTLENHSFYDALSVAPKCPISLPLRFFDQNYVCISTRNADRAQLIHFNRPETVRRRVYTYYEASYYIMFSSPLIWTCIILPQNDYGMENPEIGFRILAATTGFYLPYTAPTGSGCPPASYPAGIGVFSLEVKRPGREVDWLLTSVYWRYDECL